MGKLLGDDARAVELLGGIVNDGVLERLEASSRAYGDVVLESRAITHPAFPDAVVRTPPLVALDVRRRARSTRASASARSPSWSRPAAPRESIDTVPAHGQRARRDDGRGLLDRRRRARRRCGRAALDAGVALSENLTGQVFVNQSAAFSDFHGTGANPAANATYTDGAYVASRFRFVQSRRHI